MSASVGSYGNINPLLTADAVGVHQQLDTLTQQASTGLIADTYAGLGGSDGSISLNLSPQIAALNTANNNINEVTGAMDVTQAAMTQIQQIASTFVTDIPNLNALNPSEVDSIAANAQSALAQLAGLLDTTDGNTYVFGGADSGNPPVPDPDNILSSGFYTQINAAVSALGTNGADATSSAVQAIASSNASGTSPFSTYMSQPASDLSAPVVETGEGQTVQTGLLASANSASVSQGTYTTGSYMRDLMASLATLGSLSSSQVNDSGFMTLVQNTGDTLNSVVTAMATDVGVLGNTQSQLTATQTQLTSQVTALTSQVSSAQDVDMTATLSNLTQVQTQLQESYRLISAESTMSLVNYLPAS